jgi:hypothetical protein
MLYAAAAPMRRMKAEVVQVEEEADHFGGREVSVQGGAGRVGVVMRIDGLVDVESDGEEHRVSSVRLISPVLLAQFPNVPAHRPATPPSATDSQRSTYRPSSSTLSFPPSPPRPSSAFVLLFFCSISPSPLQLTPLPPSPPRQAKSTNTSSYLLLAGQTTLYVASSFSGKGLLSEVGPGEEFTVSLGVDPGSSAFSNLEALNIRH